MGVFTFGGVTFGSLFKKPETLLYPVQTKPQPAGLKGQVAIAPDDCIVCGICQKTCPCSAITVDKKARTWSINRFRCVQCGSCIAACPKDCLSMNPDYAKPSTEKHEDSFQLPEQKKAVKEQ